MMQCTSDVSGSSNSKSAPPPILPMVMHNLLNWYVKFFEGPSITEIVIAMFSCGGISGNSLAPGFRELLVPSKSGRAWGRLARSTCGRPGTSRSWRSDDLRKLLDDLSSNCEVFTQHRSGTSPLLDSMAKEPLPRFEFVFSTVDQQKNAARRSSRAPPGFY